MAVRCVIPTGAMRRQYLAECRPVGATMWTDALQNSRARPLLNVELVFRQAPFHFCFGATVGTRVGHEVGLRSSSRLASYLWSPAFGSTLPSHRRTWVVR